MRPHLSNLCVFVLYVGIYFDVQEITPYAAGVYRFDASDQPVSEGHFTYHCVSRQSDACLLLGGEFTRYITNITHMA